MKKEISDNGARFSWLMLAILALMVVISQFNILSVLFFVVIGAMTAIAFAITKGEEENNG